MSFFRTWLFVSLAILSCRSGHGADDVRMAPSTSGILLNGEKFSLKDLRGRVVVIHFWATWCAPCMAEMTAMDSYFIKHSPEGLRMIAISLDDKKNEPSVREKMRAYHFSGALKQETHYKEFGKIRKLPLTFVMDRQGRMIKDNWDGSENGLTITDLEQVVTPLLLSSTPSGAR